MERLAKFYPRSGFGVVGDKVDTITKAVAEVFGYDKEVRINVPYHNFNLRGKAGIVADDAVGVMPFSKKPKDVSEVTTMFYGDEPIKKCNYLPIWSDVDVFFIESINDGTIVEINLVKAPCWREYL